MAGLEDKLTICLQMLNGTHASVRIYEEDGKSIKARVKTLNLNIGRLTGYYTIFPENFPRDFLSYSHGKVKITTDKNRICISSMAEILSNGNILNFSKDFKCALYYSVLYLILL